MPCYCFSYWFIWAESSRKLFCSTCCPSPICLPVRPPVRPSVCPSSWPSVNFSHYHFLLKNKCANFKAIRLWPPWVKDHALTPFTKGRYVCNNKIPKIHWRYSKMFSGNQIYILKVLFSKYWIIATAWRRISFNKNTNDSILLFHKPYEANTLHTQLMHNK